MYVSVCTLVSRYVSRDLRFPKSKQSTAKLSSCKLGGFSENSCHFVFHALKLLYSRRLKQPDNTSNRNVTPGGKDKLFLTLDNQTVCEGSKAKLANVSRRTTGEVLNVSLAVHANLTALTKSLKFS